MKIKGANVLITGAASGMGAATARHLTKLGASVALLDIDLTAAQQLADELSGFAVQCDVAEADSAEKALAMVADNIGPVRVCINCAGIAPGARIVGRDGPQPLNDFNRVIQINLIGSFNIMRLAASQMISQDPIGDNNERGVIINTASIAAYEGQIGQAAYSASKGGIVSMTLPAAREFAKFGVRVMTIAPGLIETPMMQAMTDKVREALLQTVKFPQRLGKATEYADLVQHIIENPLLNGSTIRLDGAVRLAS